MSVPTCFLLGSVRSSTPLDDPICTSMRVTLRHGRDAYQIAGVRNRLDAQWLSRRHIRPEQTHAVDDGLSLDGTVLRLARNLDLWIADESAGRIEQRAARAAHRLPAFANLQRPILNRPAEPTAGRDALEFVID